MRKFTPLCLILTAGLLINALRADAANPAVDKPIEAAAVKLGRPVDFDKDVYPILESNCVACHNSAILESKLNLESAETIRKGGKRGPSIAGKDPAASLLFQFASRTKQPAMPPLPNKVEANALTPKELGILKQWILEGAAAGGGNTGDAMQWQPIPAGMKSILSVALTPGGRFVAAGRANQLFVYDAILGREVARLIDPQLTNVLVDGRPMYPGGAADRDFIHALAFSPDESLLAAGGYRTVKLWKRPQNVQKLSVALAAAPTALAVSPDHSLIAVATADNQIDINAAKDGKAVRRLTGPSAEITALEFSTDGKTLYSASLDKSWRAWTIADGKAIATVVTPAPIKALAVAKNGTVAAAGTDGIIRLWSPKLPASSPPRDLKGHSKSITALAFVVPAETRLVSGSDDGSVRIWDLANGKQVASLDQGAPVTAIAVRPDGRIVASAGMNKVTRLWQVSDGKRLAELKGDIAADRLVIEQIESQTIAAQHIATADARVKVAEQDVKERHEAIKKAAETKTASDKALAESQKKEKPLADAVAAADKALKAKPKDADLKMKAEEAEKAFVAAKQATKSATDAVAAAVRGKEGADKALKNSLARQAETNGERKSAEAAKLVANTGLGEVKKAADARELPIRALAFSADGKELATAGDDAIVHLWDAEAGRPLETFRGHSAPVGQLAFNGGSLVSAAADKRLIVWDTNPAWTFFGRIGAKPDAPLDLSASPFVSRVLALAFNHSGTLLATGGGDPSRSGELKIWNVPSLTLARDLKDAHSDTVLGVAFSRDGKYLAGGAADKFVKVFEVATGKHVRSFEGHTHHVLGVAWKADGSLLASAGADNQIKVWNFESGEQVRSIANHTKQVTSIQFIGTGDDVVTASGDKSVRLSRTSDGSNQRTFDGGTDYMYSAAATRDGSAIVAGGEDGVLRIWNGANGKNLMTFDPPKPPNDSAQANAAKR